MERIIYILFLFKHCDHNIYKRIPKFTELHFDIPFFTEVIPKNTELIPKVTELRPIFMVKYVPKNTELIPKVTELVPKVAELIPNFTEVNPANTHGCGIPCFLNKRKKYIVVINK